MKQYLYPPKDLWAEILTRPTQNRAQVESLCAAIFEDVKLNGDKALRQYTLTYDKVDVESLKAF